MPFHKKSMCNWGFAMIDIIDTLDGFKALKPIWETLEKHPRLRIFQTYLWCRTAWDECLSKEKDNRLWILKWHQDGKDDVVIFPFFIDGKGCLRYIMDTHSDICNTIYFGANNRHLAYKEAAECIVANKDIKCVWLQKMYGDAEALRYLGVFLPAAVVYKDNAFSWVHSDKCDDFIAGQSHMRSKDKADLKAIRRKAGKYRLSILSATNGDEFPIKLIESFRERMLAETRREIAFLPDELISFVNRIYESGCADIVVLNNEGAPVALNFVLKKANRYLSWIFLYTDPRASTLMYVKLLSEMAKRESFIFDFGVGVYSYKIGTFRPETGVTLSLRCGFTAWEHIKCAIAMNWRFTKDYVKMRLRKAK